MAYGAKAVTELSEVRVEENKHENKKDDEGGKGAKTHHHHHHGHHRQHHHDKQVPRSAKWKLCGSLVAVILGLICISIAYGGTEGTDIAWSRVLSDDAIPSTKTDVDGCKTAVFFGLVKYTIKYSSCSTGGSLSHSYDSDNCKTTFQETGPDDFCSSCYDSGASIGAFLGLSIALAVLSVLALICKVGGKAASTNVHNPGSLTALVLTMYVIFAVVAWVIWTADCHQKIRSFANDLDKVKVDASSAIYVGTGLTITASGLAVIAMLTALLC
uniref:Uncharacterized protein n=1 Tax=Lotharella oceanica TaxID=641309 RepID=A0A7S2X699_9EUKA